MSWCLIQILENFLKRFVKQQERYTSILPGMLESGKTTIAKIFLNLLDCDSITLNASDERGIDVIREKVKMFAMMYSMKKWKIVF